MEFKTIVISGAHGNLGKSVVEYFLLKGWNVIGLVHRQSTDSHSSSNYFEIEVDLMDENQVQIAVEKIVKKYSSIDVLVHTVGGFAMGSFLDTPMQKIRQQMELNFTTAYHLSRVVAHQMVKQSKGNIFLIGAASAQYPLHSKGIAAYALSKTLVSQLAHLIQLEIHQNNIFAHVVMPTIIDTLQNRKDMPNADFSTWQSPILIAQTIERFINVNQIEILVS
ncbi:MAG: SDR family NAD(P)-dependent oxidoreductase [Chitinophagales bacterium]|nr:SDR family NAD(P)-dependent oxidoreductase [Chitinophagales bacterium]